MHFDVPKFDHLRGREKWLISSDMLYCVLVCSLKVSPHLIIALSALWSQFWLTCTFFKKIKTSLLLQSYKPLLRKQKESSQYCRPHQYIVSRVCQYLNIFRQTNLTPTWYWENKNKPKMAYSRDLPKMAVWHYGLKLQWYLT